MNDYKVNKITSEFESNVIKFSSSLSSLGFSCKTIAQLFTFVLHLLYFVVPRLAELPAGFRFEIFKIGQVISEVFYVDLRQCIHEFFKPIKIQCATFVYVA